MRTRLFRIAAVTAACVTSSVLAQSQNPTDTTNEIAAPARMDVNAARTNFLNNNALADLYMENGLVARAFGKDLANGTNAVDSATNFINEHCEIFGMHAEELLPIGPNGEGLHVLPMGWDKASGTWNFSLVGYLPSIDDIRVYGGSLRVLVRHDPGFPVVLVANEMPDMRAYDGRFAGSAVAPSKLNANTYLRHVANQFFHTPTIGGLEQVIWAGRPGAWAEPQLAVTFIANGGSNRAPDTHQKYRYVVNAKNGRVLYQESMILDFDVSGQVTARVTQGDGADNCGPEEPEPLPHARITVGGSTSYTNAAGNFLLSGSGSQTVTSDLSGRYYVVNDEYDGSVGSMTETISNGGSHTFEHNSSNLHEYDRAEVNAYIWANKTRDWTIDHHPSYPTVWSETNFPININLGSNCNAYYDYSSINFYTAGGGCPNTAFSDVVAHELGHHLVSAGGSGQGQYGEGAGDCNGILLTREPTLGNGFQGDCNQGIRSADNDYQYPQTGQIHDAGQLISGCVWDMLLNLGGPTSDTAIDTTSYCWINSIPMHTGDQITPAITIDFLTVDDNDGNIYNGTPHYAEINAAFSHHNMPGPDLALIDISLPDGAPTVIDPNGQPLDVTITDLSGEYANGTGRLTYSINGGPFQSSSLSNISGDLYRGNLPAADCGSTIGFYVSAQTTDGYTETSPAAAPANVYAAAVATGFETILDIDFQSDPGWIVSGVSGAALGAWEIGTPCGTTTRGAPGQDYDGSGRCYLTGNGSCDANLDVDDGCAVLTTAPFSAVDAEGNGDATVNYAVWYDNTGGGIGADPSNDIFTVELSTNNGSTFTTVLTIGPLDEFSSGGWNLMSFQVGTYGTPSDQCVMRFTTCDAASGSVIEAAVDAFSVELVLCDDGGCDTADSGDVNGDGITNGADLSIFLGSWGSDDPSTDRNCDGITDGADLSILLGNWG